MNATHSTCPVALNTTKYFTIPMYSVALTVGLPLNCLALWAVITHIRKSIVLSVYVLNVVLANLLQSILLPFWIAYSSRNHHWILGQVACVVVGVVHSTNFYAKNSFLCLIAMDRYIGLIHPMKFHRLQTLSSATKVSVVAWLLVAILCAAGIWLEMKDLGTWQGNCLDSIQLGKDYAHFKISTMSLTLFIPCILMGFFYLRVLLEVRKMTSLHQRVKRRICGFSSVILASYFLLYTPFQLVSFYRFYWTLEMEKDKICDFKRSIFNSMYFTWCLATLANILDPLLYVLLLKDVQADLKDQLSFKGHRTENTHKLEDLPLHSTTEQT
ncbi:G-protein coupled receptor 4-like [Podarcis raffonei]|uniref:G-protein coupled receptor 4-like n=1 Tax=Podarcis raffonei TaxID=65483 RepID=UPI00232985C9|nr:G-protein coupled receptor 4-like [Podarcis raffonei]